MKKLILKSFLLIIPVLLILALSSFAYRRTNYWQDENDVKKFKTMPYNVQLANVGSSHGQVSLKYDVTSDYVCANLGLAGQRHDMSYLVLNQYIDHMSENAVLLIPISYFEITGIYSNFEDNQAGYYRILTPELIPNYSFSKKIRFVFLPILSAGKNTIKILFDKPKGYQYIQVSLLKKADEKRLSSIAEKRHKEITFFDKGEEGFAYNQQAVAKIIDLCHEHNIKPVLITTPITDVLNEYFDNTEGFFDTFYRFIGTIEEKYPDIPYFDYSHDERFSPDHTLFRDGDHLNLWGAEKFTRIVVDDLEQAGLLVK